MTKRPTRRAFLGSVAATIAVGSAGCLDGGSGGGETDTATDAMGMEPTASMDDGSMATTESMGGMAERGMTESGMTESEMTEGGGMDGGMTESGRSGTTESGTSTTRTFEVTVRNVSEAGTVTTSEGEDVAVPLSPAVYAVHTGDSAPFQSGEPASEGLEALAEDGVPGGLVSELSGRDGVSTVDAVATPVGADAAGPLGPGDAYSFAVEAGPAHRLTLATMFVQSNDLFYAPDPAGIALFEDGESRHGDVTDRFSLWDAGTERNQEPGTGPDQAPRQSGPDTGPAEEATVRPVAEVMDDHAYPDTADVLEVSISTP